MSETSSPATKKPKRSAAKGPTCPDCAKALSPHQQDQGVLVCPVCKGEFRKCTYQATDKSGKRQPECGGRLRWNDEDGYWLCDKCGKQFGDQSRRNPAPDVAAEIRQEHEERQRHPPEWAREIVRGVENHANSRPEVMGIFHVDIRFTTKLLVEERKAEDPEAPSARRKSIREPEWLSTSCPKSLLGPNGAPLLPWKRFALATFHDGLRHAEAMGAIMPPEWSAKGPKAPLGGDPVSRMGAFFESPEYQQYQQSEEYDRYVSISVDAWQRHAPVLRRYLADLKAELSSAVETDGKDAPPDAFGRVPWDKDNPDYLPLSEAIADLADGAILVKTLGKIVRREDVDMRWMNKGQRTNVHVGDFIRWWKRQSKSEAELDALLDGVEDRKQTERDRRR